MLVANATRTTSWWPHTTPGGRSMRSRTRSAQVSTAWSRGAAATGRIQAHHGHVGALERGLRVGEEPAGLTGAAEADVARLSLFVRRHVNMLCRCSVPLPELHKA